MNHNDLLIPDYIKNLRPYEPGRSLDAESHARRPTRQISKLSSNENPLGPSPFAIKNMTQGLWELHRYPDMYGIALKKALGELYSLEEKNIVLGNGSEGIMGHIARAIIQVGDEVLTSDCTFIGFTILARSTGAKLVSTPLTSDYRFDVEAMAKKISTKTKIVYIANPNNPTGTYIRKEEFDFLMQKIPAKTLVILDEAYFEFAEHVADYPDSMDYRYDNVVTLRTFSKAYGLGGIRVGYGFGHEWPISNLQKVKAPFEPNLLAQLGAVGAIKDRFHLNRTLRNNKKMYDFTFDFLEENGFQPVESLANFIAFPTVNPAAAAFLYDSLLDHGVIIRPIRSPGMDHFLRVSLGTPKEMQHFVETMNLLMPDYRKQFKN